MPQRKLQGVIVSDKMDKTRVIRIDRLRQHTKYRKFYTVSTKLKAHDEKNEFKIGETVIIVATRPLSKEKRWRIVERVDAAKK